MVHTSVYPHCSARSHTLGGYGGRETGQRECVLKGRDGSGETGRKLSPSLLSAPWRAQLLILAGDVELNPGPFTTKYGQLKASDQELVVKELKRVAEKWKLIGRALTTGWSVDDIKYPDATECLSEVVRRRLHYSITYWGNIIGALRKVDESQLANHLFSKYSHVPFEVTQHPESQSVPNGAEAIFKIEARGSNPTFQWQKNGKNLDNDSNFSGTNTEILKIQHVKKSDGGCYRCLVENEAKKREVSKEAKLTVFDPPEVTQHPKSKGVPNGAETKFKIEAIGDDLTFQWQKNGHDVHNDSKYRGTDTNMLQIRDTKKSDEGCYRCRVGNDVSMKLSDEARLRVSCIQDSVNIIDITTHTYSGTERTIEMTEYGYKMHFPDSALPPEVDECQVHVESSLSGLFHFPDTELISGVYWITTEQKFNKAVTVEFQHCVAPDHAKNLTFVVAKRTPEDLPYNFNIHDGGEFSRETKYGSISLTHFCGFAIGYKSPTQSSLIQKLKDCCCGISDLPDLKGYSARFYYESRGNHSWEVYFVITWNMELHITAANRRYGNCRICSEQQVTFEEEEITLDIAQKGVVLSGGWKVFPYSYPGIRRSNVNAFNPGQQVPSCQLHVTWNHTDEPPTELEHLVHLLGAKVPYNWISLPALQPAQADDQGDRPTLMECIRFRGRERRINIPQEIGDKYHNFGLELLDDRNGVRIRSIAHEHRDNAEQINTEVLQQWITGRGKQPVTWNTLTQVLRNIELNTLAGEIEAVVSN